MKIFVAGASGVIGRRLVPQLLAAGHEVVGMTRSLDRAEALRAMGAEAVVCDVYDPPALREAVVKAAPEVVVNQLTDIPPAFNPRRYAQEFARNDRVRTEGTRNLVDAAAAAGARRMIAQSIAFAYAPGSGLATEDEPLHDDAPAYFRRSVEALHFLEDATTGTTMDGLVLRYGFFYGPGTSYASDGHWARETRRRRFPIVGEGGGVTSFIHIDDAASSTLSALSAPTGVYNVVDDEPAAMRDWLPVYASALGAKPPRRVPAWLARLIAGDFAVSFATLGRGASNARAKRELGWVPRYPSWRTGFKEALG